MTSPLTPDELAAVARFLGSEYSHITTKQHGKQAGRKLTSSNQYIQRRECDGGGTYLVYALCDDMLAMAILLRMAELGEGPHIGHVIDGWFVECASLTTETVEYYATPRLALVAAVVTMEAGNGN